jgi:hypothetical protein
LDECPAGNSWLVIFCTARRAQSECGASEKQHRQPAVGSPPDAAGHKQKKRAAC